MKTIHKHVLKAYIGPLLMTFFIALFVLLMQFLWKFVDDLVGKGLEWHILLELLFYASATFIPLALPLSILLSSLMTFGNLGEHFELVAMKSSGISLRQIMKPLIILSIIICLAAFFFSNYVLPVANLKMGSLLYDVKEQKPALNIKEGVFYNGIDNYVIKVGKKETDGKTVHDVIIYDHSSRSGNVNVTVAEKGKMETTDDERYLVFTLYNGSNYWERSDQRDYYYTRPLQRTTFSEEAIRFDLSGFALTRTDVELFKDNFQMLNLKQLTYAEDSMQKALDNRYKEFYKQFKSNFQFVNSINAFATDSLSQDALQITGQRKEKQEDTITKGSSIPTLPTKKHLASRKNPKANNQQLAKKQQIVDYAIRSARNLKEQIHFSKSEYDSRKRLIIRHQIEWQRKFTLSFACLILFFIGAPLGAIIRKGGFGLPVVISIVFFVIFHVMSMTAEKITREGVLPAWEGMWIASLITLPIGIYLTYKATVDAPLLDAESWAKVFRKVYFFKKEKNSNGNSANMQ